MTLMWPQHGEGSWEVRAAPWSVITGEGPRPWARVPVGPSAAAWPREGAETQDMGAETRFRPGAVRRSWVSWGRWFLSPRTQGGSGQNPECLFIDVSWGFLVLC